MKEQAKNPRIIIDVSYIRGMDECTARSCFGAMCEQGGRIVIIDTSAYELFTTFNCKQWPASQIKLKTVLDSIEAWEHVAVMERSEIECNRPYGDPLNHEKTQDIRQMLKRDNPYIPNNSEEISKKAKQNREYDSIIEIFKGFIDLQLFTEEEKKKIQNKSGDSDEVVQFFYEFVNNPSNIQASIDTISQKSDLAVSLDLNAVDDNWVIWHSGKSLLVMYCYSQYQGKNKISKKKLINTKHDLDYLVSLAFADAIASKEKKEMFYFRQWMFGDTKPLIDSHEPEDIARVMDSLKSSSTGSSSQGLVARDQETLSQVDFMKLSLEERRQILAQQAEQMKSHYRQTKDERTEWQTGDFIDVY